MMPVNRYLLDLPADKRAVLQRVRAQIKHILPATTEEITYGMPAFTYRGKYLIAYAAFTHHFSLFPGALPQTVLQKLDGFTVSEGTIQFTADKPVPELALRHVLAARVGAIDQAVAGRKV